MKTIRKAVLATVLAAILTVNAAAQSAPAWLMETEAGESAEALITAADAEQWEQTATIPEDASGLSVGGKGSILVEMDTGAVLFAQNADAPLPIASVTKIMTLLLVMEAIEDGRLAFTDVVTCSETAATYGGSQIWLEPGETMTVDDLLKAIAVVSANDACAAMAEHLDGSVEAFVERMNARAKELGMEHTEFRDCCGLDDTAFSTARDVSIMAGELMKHKEITNYTTIWMDTLRDGKSSLVNTNKLIRYYKGATGLKTGTTSTAGHCLAGTAGRDGLRLCAVILGCASTDERFSGVRTMLDYGFARYALFTPTIDATKLVPIPVRHGVTTTVMPARPILQPVLCKKGEEKKITCEMTLKSEVQAPVAEGEILGRVTVKNNGKTLQVVEIKAAAPVAKMTLSTALCRLWAALA